MNDHLLLKDVAELRLQLFNEEIQLKHKHCRNILYLLNNSSHTYIYKLLHFTLIIANTSQSLTHINALSAFMINKGTHARSCILGYPLAATAQKTSRLYIENSSKKFIENRVFMVNQIGWIISTTRRNVLQHNKLLKNYTLYSLKSHTLKRGIRAATIQGSYWLGLYRHYWPRYYWPPFLTLKRLRLKHVLHRKLHTVGRKSGTFIFF